MFKNEPIALNPLWTEEDFILRSQQICQQLQQDKIQAVGLWLEDASEFACVLLACLNAGVRVLLPPNLLDENRQWVADNADFFFQQAMFVDYGCLQKSLNNQPLVDKTRQTEILLKTSGSSGRAKIICKTAAQMWREAGAIATVLPFEKGRHIQVLGSVSVQHLYGLTFRIFVALEMGWRLGREQAQYPEYLIAANRRQKSIWISSPALLSRLNLDNDELGRLALVGLISSGGTLPKAVADPIRRTLSCPLIEIYGSSETGVIAYRQENELWLPMPHSFIGQNEQGALWVENPWIKGREQTADAVELQPHGFHLLGRLDRIVKLGDRRVSLVKIEQALLVHHWVLDVYVGLHPQSDRPVAWLALNTDGQHYLAGSGRKGMIAELKTFLAKTQEAFALPRYWRFSESLPRNSQSKISRADFERVCCDAETI